MVSVSNAVFQSANPGSLTRALVARLRPRPLPTVAGADRDVALAIVHRYGSGALLPFLLTEDKRLFHVPGREGVVVYGSSGRVAVALGDPVGPAGADWDTFDDFTTACLGSGRIPAVYQASSAARRRLLSRGYRVFQVGRESVVDLTSFGLSGAARANLRHTVTRSRRGGVAVGVHPAGVADAERVQVLADMRAIDARWRERAGPEMGFTIGTLAGTALDEVAVAIARDGDGTPIAFATFRPTGADRGWMLDLMRRVPGSTPGAFEACIVEAAFVFREEGAAFLSLGLVPLAGLSPDSRVPEERALALAARAVKPWYDVHGLEFFKQKFNPTQEPRFIAIRARHQLPGLALALLGLHLGGIRHAIRGTAVAEIRRLARMASAAPRRRSRASSRQSARVDRS
jgi:phosphatidylglycerol lysyltransferase